MFRNIHDSEFSFFFPDDRVRAICLAMGLIPVLWTSTKDGGKFDTNGLLFRALWDESVLDTMINGLLFFCQTGWSLAVQSQEINL